MMGGDFMEKEELRNRLYECQDIIQRIISISLVSSQCRCIEPTDSCFIFKEIFNLSHDVSSIIIDLEKIY